MKKKEEKGERSTVYRQKKTRNNYSYTQKNKGDF